MEGQKKNKNLKNNSWFCKCGNQLGEFIADNVVKIRGPIGQEYEIGFNYIEVTCPKCHKKCCLESKELVKIQNCLEHLEKNEKLAKLALNSGEAEIRTSTVRPLNDMGLKSFYSLEDRQRKILRNELSEWQKKIYDCLYSMELESDITDSEDWDRITKLIAKKLNTSCSKVEKDIIIIEKAISKILRNT